MATSSSVNFSMTRNEIITDALMLIGAIGADETLESSDIAIANRALNRLIKSFENQAIHVWKRSEATVFLQADQESYVLGSGSTDYATETYVQTTVSSSEALGQTIISISSVTGINIGDFIGIVLDDNTLQWSTVSAVGASTVTINDALTDSATAGNVVYAFTTKINKPLNVLSVRRRTVSSETELPVTSITYEEYQDLPNKTQSGTPIQWVYDRKITDGTLYVWQPPSDVSNVLKITYSKPLEDFDAATDTPDLPQEWYDAIVYQLAVRLAPMYRQTGTNEYQQLKQQADQILNEALNFDTDESYIQFVPKVI